MPRFRTSLLLAFLVLSTSLDAATLNTVRRRAVNISKLPPIMAAAAQIALDQGVPGLSIAVVYKGETVVRGYGFSDVFAKIPARDADFYQIGSVTKQFTAAAIMRLVEQDKVSLDDSIRKYVPEIAPLDGTIRQLLTHTSGIDDYFTKLTDGFTPMTNAQMIAFIKAQPNASLFPPGRSWSYSNSGYYLLGMVIERVTGKSYADVLREMFFEPLAMTSTSYCGIAPASPSPSGYIAVKGFPLQRTQAIDMSLAFAAGAVCSTALDLAHWSRDLESGRVVTSASYTAMTTAVKTTTNLTVPYGFGLVLSPIVNHPAVSHDGSIRGYTSELARFPDDDLTIAVLLNATTLEATAYDVAKDIAAKIFAPPI
jgi:CubicO group peptidase (beta-lactamase class C family)